MRRPSIEVALIDWIVTVSIYLIYFSVEHLFHLKVFHPIILVKAIKLILA